MKNILIAILVSLTAQAFSQKLGISGGMLTYYRITTNDTIKEHYPISACSIDYQKSQNDIQIFYNTGFAPRKVFGGKWNSTLNGDINDFIEDFTDGAGGGSGGTDRDIYPVLTRKNDSLQIDWNSRNITTGDYENTGTEWLDDVFNSATAAGTAYFEVTHKNLTDLRNDMQFIPGAWYLLTDYKCTFWQPFSGYTNTDAAQESLLLLALSNNTLSNTAYSPQYPHDIIQYSLEGSYYLGYALFGEITRRTDTRRNISVPFDFRAYQVEQTIYNWPTFDNGQTYDFMDIVTDGGKLYICLWDATVGIATSNATYWQQTCNDTEIRAVGNTDGFDWLPSNVVGIPPNTGDAALRTPFDFSQSRNFIISGQPADISECQFWNEGSFTNCYFTALKNVHFRQSPQNLNGTSITKSYFLSDFNNSTFEDITNVIINGRTIKCEMGSGFKNIATEALENTKFGRNFESNVMGRNFNYNDIADDAQQNSFGQDINYITTKRTLFQCHMPSGFQDCTIYPEVIANDWSLYNGITTTPQPRTKAIVMDDVGQLVIYWLTTAGTFSFNNF